MAKPQKSARPRLGTLQAISDAFGPPVNSLRDLISRGHLTPVRLPGNRRVFLEYAEVERLIDASREVVS